MVITQQQFNQQKEVKKYTRTKQSSSQVETQKQVGKLYIARCKKVIAWYAEYNKVYKEQTTNHRPD